MFGYASEWRDPQARTYRPRYWDEDLGRRRSEIFRYPWSLPSRSNDYLNYISLRDRLSNISRFPYQASDFLDLEFGDIALSRWLYEEAAAGRHHRRSSYSSSFLHPSRTTPFTYGPSLENSSTLHGSMFNKSHENVGPATVSDVNDTSVTPTLALDESAKTREGSIAGKEGKDVMISYSHQDTETMQNIKKLLESSGISVSVGETGITPDSLGTGGAVFRSSAFLIVLSLDSAKSKYCRGEISSAYISNKNIFVVALAPFIELSKALDVGTRMVLHTLQWHFVNGDVDDTQLKPLVNSIKTALLSTGSTTETDHITKEDGQDEGDTNFTMNEHAFLSINKSADEGSLDLFDRHFWHVNFGTNTQIAWTRFVEVLDSSFENLWKQLMISDQQKKELLHRMSKDMTMDQGIVTFHQYKKFCTRSHDELPLSQAIRLYAAETYAMKGVFDVNSTVRLSAIANLKKFQSKAVIDSLLNILEAEEDPDVRVVAAMSLAHAASGIESGLLKARAEKSLISCLDHPDRLVRESGCLALGRLKSKKSVPKLVQKWRNDVISTVREAAQIAINQIGGDDAEQAMHVTKILSEEISLLKQSLN